MSTIVLESCYLDRTTFQSCRPSTAAAWAKSVSPGTQYYVVVLVCDRAVVIRTIISHGDHYLLI